MSAALQEVGAGGRILAALDGDRDDLDVVAAGQARPDLQAGGAVFAIDEDLRFHIGRKSSEFRYHIPLAWFTSAAWWLFMVSSRAFRSASRPR